MALEIKLNQKLSQSLVMTPQLQQAIKLLQLGRLEYQELLEKELMENPVLEDASEDSSGGQTKEQQERQARDERSQQENEGSKELDSSDQKQEFDWAEQNSSFYEGNFVKTRKGDSWDDDGPSIEATLKNPEGLSSHLLWQLRTSELGEEGVAIALQIIGNLDANGMLDTSLEDIASSCELDVADVEVVLKVIQMFDPPGIAARDLGECLYIQLEQLGLANTLAGMLVREHLEDLGSRRYDQIAKKLNIAKEELYEAIKIIQTLEPRPGRPFSTDAPPYITPDVYVKKTEEGYQISLNDSGMPRLRVSERYRELLNNKDGAANSPDKEYLQERLKAASWLLKSIEQRQQTIYKVSQCIMKFQSDFLEKGVTGLRPLVLRDIAEEVGIHESTVSRVTSNKFIHTPQGVFELKFFFTSGLKSDSGQVSSESVKERIRELIAEENPKKPLSDQAIVNALRSEGIDIARRTVAKYREMMNILSSSQRKKHF